MARGEVGDRARHELCAGGRSAGARRRTRSSARISVYAQGGDYHKTVKKALKALARFIVEQAPSELKVFVDTAPVMEKPLAQAAGIGWQGKHTNLVSREHGSWLFLGVILTSLELEPDAPADQGQHCGSCTRCLDACPTQAFVGPHRIDARRCISYLTIEHDGPIPEEFRAAMGNRIYGCDDCLAVCPWNRFADAAAANRAFLPRAELAAPRLADLLALDDAAFREMFAGSPIKRIGVKRMIRNCLIAAGNSGDAALAPAIERASRRSRPGDRRSGALGAGSARVFERGDAGRLIHVGARRRARVDMGDAQRAAAARRIEIGVEHAARGRGTAA